jgi:hypothetical protein
MCSLAQLTLFLLAGAFVWGRDPLQTPAKVVALVFISSECPISNRMAPEIERLYQKYSTDDVSICLVYPNISDSENAVQEHRRAFRLNAPYVRDTNHALVRKAAVSLTPEAAVFNKNRDLVYRGRITDQFLSIGRARPEATTHDLEEAIDSALAGKRPKEPFITAIGCYIEDR